MNFTSTWGRAAIALAVAFTACAHGERRAQQQSPQSAAATEAQRTAAQAAQTDRALAQERQRLEAARQESAHAQQAQGQARQQLAQAEQRANQAQQRLSQEQASVQRLEVASRQQHDAATRAAERADAAAEQAQLAAEERQGLRSVSGRIAEASPSRLVLEDPNGRVQSFQVNASTKVLMGTEQRSVGDLQQGADARVAYDPRATEPAAAVIHVSRAKAQLPAQQQPQQQPQQPPQEQQPPR